MNNKPLIIELFSGSGSMSKEFEARGWDIITVDNDPELDASYPFDIMDIEKKEIDVWVQGRNTVFIWAGVDCSHFSIMTAGKYWHDSGVPKKDNKGVELLKKTLQIIEWAQPDFWIIENPRGMMRTLSFMKNICRYEISYCQYGDIRMKPTDLFGLLPPTFNPKNCFNENPNCNHQRSERGNQKTGTQGLKNSYERSKYPEELCNRVARDVTNWIEGNIPPFYLEGWI